MATDDASSTPVRSIDDLEATFHAGAKARDLWRIGVEYEKPVVDASGESVPYEGAVGIRRLLDGMRERSSQWEGVYEGRHLIALQDGLASITLEPGGQFEMSGQQCDSLHCAADELERHVREIVTVGREIGARFLGLGIVPKTPLSRIPWMPKHRYEIMRRIMARTGTLGLRMMGQTATVQCNFDYGDEKDAADKMRVSMAMGPVLVAVSANSPVVDGRATGFQSFRSHIWTDTDADRCGVLPFVFETDALFGAYTQYALDVPMYFIKRAGRLIEVGGMTFRRFLELGWEGERATLADWTLHLTTLFPEVRLKTYIEVRSADSQSVDLMLGTPALMKGILYDADCLAAAWDVVKAWPANEISEIQDQAARKGLAGRAGRHSLGDIALEVLAIAEEGLARQHKRNSAGRDERLYLEKLSDEVRGRRNPATRIIEQWEGPWNGDVDRLIDYAAYRLS
ncbi:MAG TPA: glutamate-cysteine ligase family protein [Candidatus Limnocylindrales bacterium]|nr:glutamate-cysteine ligase family protein [Candidatus Limnocylindrales bacterium]